jgi:hypothetical protein
MTELQENTREKQLHELRNHLAVIAGFADMLIANMPAGAPEYDDIVAIREAANAAITLTRSLK